MSMPLLGAGSSNSGGGGGGAAAPAASISDDFSGDMSNWYQYDADGTTPATNAMTATGGVCQLPASGNTRATNTDPLTSSTHYSQVTRTSAWQIVNWIEPMARISAADDSTPDCYRALFGKADGGGTPYRHDLYKIINGTATEIGTWTSTSTSRTTIRLDADGTTIRLKGDGTTLQSATNSDVTTGVYAGMELQDTSGNVLQVDNFSANVSI